ncbi:Hypothetical predicted protein [Prunus dulcis]|uniref:Uncharacterized protein n=1 Tax=Prunus dulcis TaxID=3755 RepID=A0A5E4GBF8_PRUDU|nr:Hypothetical predicted protein [Prunus dulcis]
MWDFVQVAVVVTLVLEIRFSNWELRQVSGTSEECLTSAREKQFMKWVRFVRRLKHSVFKTAKNKLVPSYTLHVAKNHAAGDFTNIHNAIDSLPFINLLRVVIKVHAGVYT